MAGKIINEKRKTKRSEKRRENVQQVRKKSWNGLHCVKSVGKLVASRMLLVGEKRENFVVVGSAQTSTR